MKCISKIIILFALFLLLIPSALATDYTAWGYQTEVNVSGTTRPYQLSLNVSNATGTNNATWVFCNGHCNAGFTDIQFSYSDNTNASFWIENATGINSTTARVWVNLTTTNPYQMNYGYAAHTTSMSNGSATFPIFDHFDNGTTLNTTIWNEGGAGAATVANSNLTLTDVDYVYSKSMYSSNQFMRTRARFGADTDDHFLVGFIGYIPSGSSLDYTKMNVPLKSDTPDGSYQCIGGKSGSGYH